VSFARRFQLGIAGLMAGALFIGVGVVVGLFLLPLGAILILLGLVGPVLGVIYAVGGIEPSWMFNRGSREPRTRGGFQLWPAAPMRLPRRREKRGAGFQLWPAAPERKA
jgi:hypothetical protein